MLTDDGALAQRLTDPRHKLPKTYLVQVEGEPVPAMLDALRRGVTLGDGPTLPAETELLDAAPPGWRKSHGRGACHHRGFARCVGVAVHGSSGQGCFG